MKFSGIISALILLCCLTLPLTAKAIDLCCNFPDSSNTIVSDSLKKDTCYWSHKVKTSLTLSQYAYSNWAAGGNSSVSGVAGLDANLKYERNIITFNNTMNVGYGYMFLSKEIAAPQRKTEDKLNFYSQLNYKVWKKLSYSLLLDFKTQFSNGYTYPNDSVIVSRFFAPGYLTLSFGVDVVPIKQLSVFLSPISGKFTFVADEKLANAGAYGVTPAVYAEDGVTILTQGNQLRSELGFNFVLKYNHTIKEKIVITSKFELHNNYLDEDITNRWNFDVDWESKCSFLITKHFTTNIYWRIIYDDNIKFAVYEEVDGVQVKIKEIPKLQFLENLGIALSFAF
ncbi:MAG: DUF3078 domain-containing protein [Bacteroidales bacterium]|jgi:hypothetical protein|nr:DUF3078 domain-containing protein [Bacteroidales bacterium]MDD2205081.1 DUF3078 domain-containing protein [Bacteroidales bacterium]MDD3153158.1 DUF3078 domain-containing protein [Bacteroidales bacterium]MDD3914563.1 DUF3078 domain-containing protein [Bacteroidales bacterium]MDD4634492.1 DUF3078 domain-containing protein [Bacteroidales bacterium]